MSELDGISPKEMDAFKAKYVDTHTEIKAESMMLGATSGQYRKKNSIKFHPGDKNARNVKKLKRPIEAMCMKEQDDKTRMMLVDAFHVRGKEILDKKDYPIKDLVNAVIKMMPQRIDQKIEHDMSFAEMVKSVTIEKKHYKAIDAED